MRSTVYFDESLGVVIGETFIGGSLLVASCRSPSGSLAGSCRDVAAVDGTRSYRSSGLCFRRLDAVPSSMSVVTFHLSSGAVEFAGSVETERRKHCPQGHHVAARSKSS